MSFLPGMFPAMSPQGFSLTYIGKVTALGTSVDLSALDAGTRQAGDLCLFWNYGTGTTDPTDVTPSGFTSLIHELTANNRARISAKKLTGSETTVSGIAANLGEVIVAAVFRPSTPFTSWTSPSTSTQITDGDPISQTIFSASAPTYPVLAFGHMGSNSTVSPRTTSPTMSEINAATTTHYCHYKIYNSGDSLSDHTYDMTDVGDDNMLQSSYLYANY